MPMKKKTRRPTDQVLKERIKRIQQQQTTNRLKLSKPKYEPTLKAYVKAKSNSLTRNDTFNKYQQKYNKALHKFYMRKGSDLQEAINKRLNKIKRVSFDSEAGKFKVQDRNNLSYRQKYIQKQIKGYQKQDKLQIRRSVLQDRLEKTQNKLAEYYKTKQDRYAQREHAKWVKATSGRKKYELSVKAQIEKQHQAILKKIPKLREKLYQKEFKEAYKEEYGFDVGKTDKIYQKGLGNVLSDKSVELVRGILDKIRNQLGGNEDLQDISKFMDNDDYLEGLTKKQITKLEVYEEKLEIRQDVLDKLNALFKEYQIDPSIDQNSRYLEDVNSIMGLLVNEYKLSDNQIVVQAHISKQWLGEITTKINKYKGRKVYIQGYHKLWQN